VPKGELLRDVWGYASLGMSRTVDAHACRLRRKLSCGERRYIGNVRGVGYRLFADGVV
jgi:DNA-binding response OmpR family regulator